MPDVGVSVQNTLAWQNGQAWIIQGHPAVAKITQSFSQGDKPQMQSQIFLAGVLGALTLALSEPALC